jgi:hypothetical protein
MLVLMSFEYYKIYNLSNYLLHVHGNKLSVVKLSYSVSTVSKSNFFIDFITFSKFNKLAMPRKVLVLLYLMRYKTIKDVYFYNFLSMFENRNSVNFISRFFK